METRGLEELSNFITNYKLMVAAILRRLELERKQYESKFNEIDATARPDENFCV